MKRCTKCGDQKPLSEFGKRTDARDGFMLRCKSCASADALAYYAANRERCNAVSLAWHRANHEKSVANSKAWRTSNRDKAVAASKSRHVANRERDNERSVRNNRRHSDELAPSYIARVLRMPVGQVPPSLMDVKREHLRLIRYLRELKEGNR